MFPIYDKVLYQDSPFLPPIDTDSLYRLMALTSEAGFHPAIAVAHEVRFIVDEHGELLDTQSEWINKFFPIKEEETNFFYFGLFLPPTILLAADLAHFVPVEEALETLFPVDEEGVFTGLREYATRHLDPAIRLLDLDSPEPMLSAKPIYAHCQLEVYSDNFWYLAGLEASKYLFSSLARLFDSPTA